VSSVRVLSLIAVAVLAGAIGRWTAPIAAQRSPAPLPMSPVFDSPAQAPVVAERTDPGEVVEVAHAQSSLAEASAPGAPTLGFDAEPFLADLPRRLDELADRAHSGDARAATELAEWIDYCAKAGAIGTAAKYGQRPQGDLGDFAITTYFSRTHELCEQWFARHAWLTQIREEVAANARLRMQALQQRRTDDPILQTPLSVGDTLRRIAADAGDPIAEGLTQDRDVITACGGVPMGQPQPRQQAHWQCVHAAARERLASIFAERNPQVLEAVPRILMALGPRTLNGSEFLRNSSFQSSDLQARWILVGCQFGLNCGPTGRALRWACASEGACGYAHYRDYAADRLLPPATLRQMDEQLPRLIALILAGDVDSVLGPPPKY